MYFNLDLWSKGTVVVLKKYPELGFGHLYLDPTLLDFLDLFVCKLQRL